MLQYDICQYCDILIGTFCYSDVAQSFRGLGELMNSLTSLVFSCVDRKHVKVYLFIFTTAIDSHMVLRRYNFSIKSILLDEMHRSLCSKDTVRQCNSSIDNLFFEEFHEICSY